MYGQDAGISTATLWWALIVGLVVSGCVIYAAVRLALFHDRLMVQSQAKEAEARAARAAAKASETEAGRSAD